MSKYTIERLTWDDYVNDRDLIYFCCDAGEKLSRMYGTFNWLNFPIKDYIENYRFMVCRRDGKPVGAMLARLYPSIFDPQIKILNQDLLYTLPGTRASKMLLDDFIDFGKREANHIITMVGLKTNIKHKSLMKLGFSLCETLYEMET